MEQQARHQIYLPFFHLKRHPFSVTPDPRFFLQSRSHLEALGALIYGIQERKGFILLTGDVGTGKTTILRTLLERISSNLLFSLVINTEINSIELLQMICDDFGLTVSGRSRVELIGDLNMFLVEAKLAGKIAVVIVDEAQNLKPEALESLRMLSNLETSRDKLLQIVLCGQPELRDNLALKSLRQLLQRIAVSTELSCLQPREVERYIYHRLNLCGVKGDEIFPNEIARRIADLSGGIPRLVNIICDTCLMLAYSEGRKVISEDILLHAARQCVSIDAAEEARETPDMPQSKDLKERGEHLLGLAMGFPARVAMFIIILLLILFSGILSHTSDAVRPNLPAIELSHPTGHREITDGISRIDSGPAGADLESESSFDPKPMKEQTEPANTEGTDTDG